ncbi:hypothetical protein P153DRAFT_306312 [Dothidotthia symphoricarpi CBS 119687]|uniref:Rhodopsin domain-containing protein n=1 Tax=Dothidotthia symphoricarpi CBS 119687 TaxID=1392245 RepID=A0A6A6ARC8_9PLEO|nr:uncharacterized protein P153DRAFT_306312 [Dothidotthia symphoricarpi CBS 119687]KAF2133773.1 hypothetical protein P153DRAFT_306312 [Dothidotthia symphoricarpi CBS 119687]
MPGGIHPSLDVILSWPTPNYVDPVRRPNTILLLTCILGPITIGTTLARLWVRIFHQRNPNWDDWLMLAAAAPLITLTILYPLSGRNGLDRHIWDIDVFSNPQAAVTSRKYVLALETIFCTTSGLIKISILLFYRRLGSRVVSKTFRWVTWASIGFIAAYTVALTLAPILGCQPISAYWDQVNIAKVLSGDYKYHCFDEGADLFVASILSAVQDFMTAMLPACLYWNLRIPIRQKIALFSIFALGYGVCALAALRAYHTWHVFYETYDVTWATWDLFLVTMLELHLGAFCANVPALKVFFKHFFHDKLASRFGGSNNSKDRIDSAHSRFKSNNSHKVLQKVGSFFSKHSHSRSSRGYISDNHTSVVDHLGGVKVEKEIQISRSPLSAAENPNTVNKHDTIDVLYNHYYADIEMGYLEGTHNSPAPSLHSVRVVDDDLLEALPPLPLSPRSPRSIRSFVSMRSLSYNPKLKALPSLPVADADSGESRGEGPSFSLFPPRTSSNSPPPWKRWS